MAKNTKAKINRTSKNYGVDLSGDIDVPKLENFKTRGEFNTWKEKAKSFNSRYNTRYQFQKNKHGVVASKKEINEIKKATKQAQRIAENLKKKTAKKPFISGGKKQGTLGQRMMQMGKPSVDNIHVPKDFDFSKIRSPKHLEEKKTNMFERADPNFVNIRSERLKENYYKTLADHFNSDADHLIDEIKDIPADDFFELYLMYDEFQFDFIYTEEQTQATLTKLESVIEQYKDGKVNMDLRGF